MVNAQEYINKNFPSTTERIDIRNQQLKSRFNLSAYKNLKELCLINCGLTNYNFLRTVPNKGKLRELNLSNNSEQWKNDFDNHEGNSYQGLLTLICRHFPNLEYASLHNVPVNNPEWVIIKPLAFLPYCHTFLIDNRIGWGYEFPTTNLTRLRGDDEANRDFMKWRRDNWTWVNTTQKELIPEKELEWKRQQSSREKEAENQEISNLLFPNQPYNFDQLKQEIARLKYQELAPKIREEKTKFEQLIADAKTKASNSEKIVNLLLETQKQIAQTNEVSQKDKLNAKIEVYQTILEGNLTKEEIQTLLNKQTELYQLEKHLASLQQNQEQVAQIQQNYPKK